MGNIDGAVSERKRTYDVFLSFRGEDTRDGFTRHLYDALCRKGIITFMDDGELQLGDRIGPKLLKAIEESWISIVVFSENYAASSWCLDELVKIHDCIKSKNQLVCPIFYKVDPSDVRHQKGSYGEAMTKHESRFGKDSEMVRKWRSTLIEMAKLKGKHLKLEQGRDESKFIDDLAREIFNKVSPKDLSSDEHIVGREYLVKELKSHLELES
ncbi:TMV resistance protein N, partial [Mucuna pruriens]